MAPTININDVVFVKEVSEEELKPNDIITFRSDNSIITHRIVEVMEKNNRIIYTTKGDNNNTEDTDRAYFQDIEGKYIGKIPKIGLILSFLKNKIVFIITIIILIICIMYQRKKISNKIKRKEKRIKWEREIKNKSKT